MYSLAIIVTVLICACHHPIGTNATLTIVIQDIVCEHMNVEYYDNCDAFVDDDDDNVLVVNFTIVQKLPESAVGHFALLGSTAGNYIVSTGVDVTLPLCDMINEPIIMGPLLAVLGFSADHCPPEPGVYGCEGYKLVTDNFPDDFPSNDYKAIFEMRDGTNQLAEFDIYLNVQN